MKSKNILICVTGLTPQIVTETFYCLAVQGKIRIDELYVLTTQRGKLVITGKDDAPYTPKTPLKKELSELCSMYKVHKPLFDNSDKHIITAREESLELHDIRTDKQNILFPNKAADFIREKTSDPAVTLFCSISGGRKTMSVHLAAALSLFGRENDRLLHVLTSEEFEFKGFYPKSRKEDKALELSEIPFIRLRSVLESSIGKQFTYYELVKQTQRQLAVLTNTTQLILKTETKEVCFGPKSIRLEPVEFAFYFRFLEKILEGSEKLSTGYLADISFASDVHSFIKEKYPYYYFDERKKAAWWKSGFSREAVRTKRSKINKKLEQLFEDESFSNEFCIKSFRSYSNTSYYINASKNKIQLKY